MSPESNNALKGFDAAYAQSLALASRELLGLDPSDICHRTGATLIEDPDGACTISLSCLNRDVTVTLPAFEFSGASVDLPIWEKIIVLHYLAACRDTALRGHEISFKEVKSGAPYFPSFEGRCIYPLMGAFGKHPGDLITAAGALGGEPVPHGDAGVRVRALPAVPIVFVVWQGDDEFGPAATILFDAAIEERLPTEDIVVLCQQAVGMLKRARPPA